MDIYKQLWLDLFIRGGSLQPFFSENNIKNIAIYGCTELGHLLFNDIKKYGVNVNMCIDGNVTEFNNIKIKSPTQLCEDDFKDIDLVVICEEDTATYRILSRFNGVHGVHISDILKPCYYMDVILPYCEKMNVRPYIITYPGYYAIPNLSPEEQVLAAHFRNEIYADNPGYFRNIYKLVDEYSLEYIKNVFSQSPVITKGNRLVHSDIQSPYVNIINGVRFTHYAPDSFQHSIHLIGHCDVLGYGVDDSRTIASYLQKNLTDYYDGNSKYRVLNHGVWGIEGNNISRGFETLKAISLDPGDIAVFMMERPFSFKDYIFKYIKHMLNKSYPLYNCLFDAFCEPREIPLMIDCVHLSYYGMNRVADNIFKIIKADNLLDMANSQSQYAFVSSATRGGGVDRSFQHQPQKRFKIIWITYPYIKRILQI